MRARLYIKTPYFFKYVETVDIPDEPVPLLHYPMRPYRPELNTINAGNIQALFESLKNAKIVVIDFQFKGFDPVNNEALFVSEQK